MKLISMTEFVLEETNNFNFNKSDLCVLDKIIKYANFLSQKLKLWMFVPCKLVNGVWVVLEEPKNFKEWERKATGTSYLIDLSLYYEYQEAKDRVLFEGIKFADVQPSTEYNYYHINGIKIFEANNQYKFFPTYGFKTIEDLVKYNLEMSETAKKQIGL